jgi:hypothetical protein
MLSNTARVAFAKQAAKDTAATTGFYTMFATESNSMPAQEYDDAENFHPGIHTRASTQNAIPVKTAVSVAINVGFRLHANSLVPLLIAMGFGVTTTAQTAYQRHTLTKSNVDQVIYASMLHRVGEGSAAFERKIRAVRGTQLVLNATRKGLNGTFTGIGIAEAESTGTETIVAEVPDPILPTKGAFTWGATALGTPREHTVTITRPVDEDDHTLHTYTRNDFPEVGFGIMGEARGVDMSFDFYKKLVWGGIANTGLGEAIVTDSLAFHWLTANNISGAAVPYKLSIAMTKVECRLTNFRAAGNSIIRGDLNWRMIDDLAAAPATLLVENGIASY